MRTRALILYVLLLGFHGFSYADNDYGNWVPDDANKSTINIGLIADMGSWEGKVVWSFISMALREFYDLNGMYRTRIALRVRDSKGDSLRSIADALDLLENTAVHAIIIPKISNEELFLSRLVGKVNVPLLSFSSLSSSKHHPFFIQIAEDETKQFHGISAIIKKFKWRSFVYLYEDTADARLSQTYIYDIFQENQLDVAYQTAVSLQATDDEIINELHKLIMIKTPIFVVHLSPFLASRVFINAKKLGMMSKGYVWIVSSKTMNFLDPQDSSFCESMQGVVGFKPYIPESIRARNLTLRWQSEFQAIASNLKIRDPNIVGLRAYDAAWALAEAIENVNAGVHPSQNQTEVSETEQVMGCLTRIRVSNGGPSILSKISSSEFSGLAGEFQLRNQRLVQDKYEILNNICKMERRRVGFWTSAYGLMQDMDSHHILSSNTLGPIIWPGFSFTAPPSPVVQMTGKILRVGIPANGRFHELIDTNHDTKTFSGFCMDVFRASLDRLSDKISPEYILFHNQNGSYNDLVYQVYLQTYDAAVGDITILSNRSEYVDFTGPYSELGVGYMVKLDNDPWFFLKPLTPELWIVTACSFLLTGFIIWFIEHGINEEFQGPPAQQIGATLWFAVSTLFYAHRERLHYNVSRFVVGVWLFVVMILTASYIANLSSLLTVAQFKSSKIQYIGYSANSFIRGLIVENNINFGDNRLTPYQSPEQYYEAIRKGGKNGGVDAIMEELPYIKALVARHPRDFTIIKSLQLPQTSGFGFVFPKGSALVHEMSRAIAELREEGKLLEMEKKWLASQSSLVSQDSELPKLSPLNIHQFIGLFLVNGMSQIIAILVVLSFLLYERLPIFIFATILAIRGNLAGILRYFNYPQMHNRRIAGQDDAI